METEFLPEDLDFRQIRLIFLESAGTIVSQMRQAIGRHGDQGFELPVSRIRWLSRTLRCSSVRLGFVEIGEAAQWLEQRSAACLGAGRFTNEDRDWICEAVGALDELLQFLAQDNL